MKDLCTRFCREELLAAIGADESVKDTSSHEALEGDEYYEQEEMEEEEKQGPDSLKLSRMRRKIDHPKLQLKIYEFRN